MMSVHRGIFADGIGAIWNVPKVMKGKVVFSLVPSSRVDWRGLKPRLLCISISCTQQGRSAAGAGSAYLRSQETALLVAPGTRK